MSDGGGVGSGQCRHDDFAAWVEFNPLTREDGETVAFAFTCSITVRCSLCDERFRFIGPMDVGDVADRPTVSFDRCELRLPIAPVSAPEGFGLDRHGFTVKGSIDPERTN